MHSQAEPRIRKRVPCQFDVAGSRHNGIVLNLSRGGLFVQTSAPAHRGEDVRVDLNTALGSSDPIVLDARVVWKRIVASHLRSLAGGGMGLRIERACEAWYSFLGGALGEDPAQTALPRFRVRVALAGSPRTRVLLLRCAGEDEARRLAEQQAGAGWCALELRRED